MFGNRGFEGRSIGGGVMDDDLVSGRIVRKGKICILGWTVGLELRGKSRSGEPSAGD